MVESTLWRGEDWWIYSLLPTSILIMLQAATSTLSRRHRWIIDEVSDLLPEDELMGAYLNDDVIRPLSIDPSIRKVLEIRGMWRRWTMRLYILLVLLCALYGFLSLLLPRPPYYPLIIFLLPFASAYFLVRTWIEKTRRPALQRRPLILYPLFYMA